LARHRLLALAAALAAAFAAPGIPAARADRLGGNYRGPGDRGGVREDPPAPAAPAPGPAAATDPVLDELAGDVPFLAGLEAGRREAAFRGRPMLVFWFLRDCGTCASVADGAFRDAEVADLASRFVPVLADAEREAASGVALRVRTMPTLLVLDASGPEAGRAEGAVDPARVADLLRRALRKPGLFRPTAADRELGRASKSLEKARAAKDWKSLLGAATAIEKVGHEGRELEDARAARREAIAEAAARLESAKTQIGRGNLADARKSLARIAREFEGLDEAVEAKNLLRELAGTRPGGGPPGGGGDSNTGPDFEERLRRADGDVDPTTSEARLRENDPPAPPSISEPR
jgi:hypothetical protein